MKCLRLGSILISDVCVDLVIAALGIEWRVDIAKINRFIRHLSVVAENIKIVAVVKCIPHVRLLSLSVAIEHFKGLLTSFCVCFRRKPNIFRVISLTPNGSFVHCECESSEEWLDCSYKWDDFPAYIQDRTLSQIMIDTYYTCMHSMIHESKVYISSGPRDRSN